MYAARCSNCSKSFFEMYSQTMCETIDLLFILNMFFECLIRDTQLMCDSIGSRTNTKYIS